MRIAVAELAQETDSFSPLRAVVADFESYGLFRGNEILERMRNARLAIDKSSYCLFFPQQLAALRPLEKYLRWLPMGGQYFVCASTPKSDTARHVTHAA